MFSDCTGGHLSEVSQLTIRRYKTNYKTNYKDTLTQFREVTDMCLEYLLYIEVFILVCLIVIWEI